MAFHGEDVPTRSPLNQRIVILYNQMLKKYRGETHALWPRPLSRGLPLSSFLHSQKGGKRREEEEGEKKRKEKKNHRFAEPHISSCRQPHPQENRGKYICSLSCQKAFALSWETVREGTSVNGQESIKLISRWMVSGELWCSINPVWSWWTRLKSADF